MKVSVKAKSKRRLNTSLKRLERDLNELGTEICKMRKKHKEILRNARQIRKTLEECS